MAITGTYAKRLLPMPINAIGTGDVEAALLRIWSDKNATAVDLQRYLSAGFAWAVVHGHRTDNPADLVKSRLPRVRKVAHQKALAYSDLADAIEKINGSGAYAGTKLLIEFLALTAVRTGEARGARWDEFNMDTRTWTVPAERMKSGKVHTVPLSNRVMAILEAATGVSRNGYVFVSPAGKTLSHGTVANLLRKLDIPGTAHGLRSTFRTWAAECTDTPREICEAALAHQTGNAVEMSYQRSDYLERRRELMNQWAAFVTAENVVSIRRSA